MVVKSPDENGTRREALMDMILSNITEGVFTVDRDFRVTFFNHAAEEITGFSSNEALGRFCHEVFRTPICNQDCPLRRSLRTGQPVKNYEIDILTRSDKRQAISVCTAPLLDEGGQFLGGVETFRDLSTIKSLRKAISGKFVFQDIVSKNRNMRQIFETLPNIAQSDATVLLHGRSGTGKELFAQAIHNLSPRSSKPLIKVNCGALPEALLESELFGHVKGAFTDARSPREGRFRAADGGTIFLDEVGDTPLSVQVKLLRVLQQREFEPIGSDQTVQVDVRVVAATNQDLESLVAEGLFREDLYYRLNVILIHIPELRERTDDIPLLVDYFIDRLNHRTGRHVKGLTERAMAVLLRHDYPGNVRELENILERAFIVCPGQYVDRNDLPPNLLEGGRPANGPVSPSPTWRRHLETAERDRLVECLRRNFWSIPKAAKELGMHRTTLWRKVKRLGIPLPR
jgi:PAS domain S-box-containing protein